MMATHRSFAQRYHVAAADHAHLSDSSVNSSPGRTRARRLRTVHYAHPSSRQFPAADANKAASASSSPAAVFKNAGGLKARSMNSLMAATAAAAERERGGREHFGEDRLRDLCHPTLRVFYSEGSELSEFRLGKKRTLPQVPPSPPPLPPLPPPPEMDFECECEIAEGDANYKSLTPSQFEEHVVKTLTDGNNNRSGSGKELDADEKYREGGPQEFDNGN